MGEGDVGGTAVVWDEGLLAYNLGDHPLDPVRVELTIALARELGFAALPSATNFVAIDVGGSACAKTLLTALLEREGVFVRMPGTAPLDRCIRVTVGRPEDRAAFAAAFRRVVAAL